MNFNNSMSKVKIKGKSTYTIYKIIVLDRVYIGKTKNFKHRISCHISACHDKNSEEYNKPLFKHIREVESKGEFKFDESHFEIIEEITDYEDEEDILYCERAWFEFYRDDLKIDMLNDRRPIRTEEERKKYENETKKKYREENKDEINRKAREKIKNETPERKEERRKKRRERYAKKREAQRQVQNSHVSDVPKDSS